MNDYRATPIALSAEQVAELLGVSRAHVWRMLKRGQLPPPARLGRLSRWDRSGIERWLAAGAPCAVASSRNGGPGDD